MNYWIFKSEPDVFSFQDLKAIYPKSEPWNGVRNYQVRNMMRDDMKIGDLILFYHSSCPRPGIAGIAKIQSQAKPDPTQFDETSEYFDAKSSPDQPRWLLVDVVWKNDFTNFVDLASLKEHENLQELLILRKGNRLSITQVTESHYQTILKMGAEPSE